jgi:predicted transcriptional regulator
LQRVGGLIDAVIGSRVHESFPSNLRVGAPCCPSLATFANNGVALQQVFPYVKGMEVHFTPEQEAQLAQIATTAGIDAERLVKDAALRLLEADVRFRAAVQEGIAQADRGEFIEEAEMDARLEQMLRS